jgi:site-specific recombinase XerD
VEVCDGRRINDFKSSDERGRYPPAPARSGARYDPPQVIYFSGKRHPATLGEPEVTAFLSHLAVKLHVAAATQNQALSALLFLYKEVLGHQLGWLDGVQRATRPPRLPTVLTGAEVEGLLSQLEGTRWLIASLLYGCG